MWPQRTHPRPRIRDLSPSLERPLKRKATHEPKKGPLPDFRVAIDFGTKFTSIACTKGHGKPFTIHEFPDELEPSRTNMQVPTEILYLSSQTQGDLRKEDFAHTTLYGYEVQERRRQPKNIRDSRTEVACVTNAKLLLDKSYHIQSLKKTLQENLTILKKNGLITKPEDVIRDLLVCFFNKTKTFLHQYHGLRDDSTVEITFCVPVCWDPSANATMSACLQEALKKVKLCARGRGAHSLFMVNEAEAAAMYTLTSEFSSFKWGEVFMLLDCGGGTTDIGVYTIGHEDPFRLGKEIIPTSGAICGSGDLNKAFFDFAMQHLRHATFTSAGHISITDIIEADLMPLFESSYKRSFSLKSKESRAKPYAFRLRGLKAIDGDARVMQDAFVMSYEDMKALFMPSLITISTLMRKQILRALQVKSNVDKVVLAGGFSDSPALKEFLATTLEQINRENGINIVLITASPNTGAAGVALGALKRAENKNHGPEKIPCRSIGILHHVRNEPGIYPKEVLNQHIEDWEMCPEDGEYYIRNTIQWIIKKGAGNFQSVHDAEWEDLHIFTPAHTKAWPVEHELFASDECIEDFFKRSHPKNWGKTHKIGKVVFDLMPIKAHLELYTAADEEDGEDRYEPVVRIKMRVIDKFLDFTAYYPSKGPPLVTIQGVHEHLNLVSAFRPGTA